MHRLSPGLLAASLLLSACGGDAALDAFAPHALGTPSAWGEGIEGFGAAVPGGDTGGGGGASDAYDGTWEGTYLLDLYLHDYSLACGCTGNLTMVVEGGEIIVGFGESCALDCGIGTQVEFEGGVGSDGGASGTVSEDLSFFYTVPWTGSFSASEGTGSFSEAGLSTSQGSNTDVAGSFTVYPEAR